MSHIIPLPTRIGNTGLGMALRSYSSGLPVFVEGLASINVKLSHEIQYFALLEIARLGRGIKGGGSAGSAWPRAQTWLPNSNFEKEAPQTQH